MASPQRTRLWVALLALVGGGLPVLGYWVLLARAPAVRPDDYFAFRPMSLFQQWMAVIAGFVIKPLYMALSVLLAWLLRRAGSADLVSLRWSLLLFFLGEAFCAANYLIFGETSYLAEYLHSYGMVLAFAFAAFAAMEGLDRRVFRLSTPGKRCAALDLCGRCVKVEDVRCGAKQVFQLLILVLAVLCFVPLAAPLTHPSYTTKILGSLYHYSRPVVYQMFETRYCPAAAVVLLWLAFLATCRRGQTQVSLLPRVLFAAAIGAWGFGMFRLLLGAVYQETLVWSVFWEEASELLFVAAVAVILWLFRGTLFAKTSPET